MNFYFHLRFNIAKRSIQEFGVPIWIFFILLVSSIYAIYILTIKYPLYSPYGIIYLGWVTIFSNSGVNQVQFLKTIFPYRKYIRIRLIEHSFLLSPLFIISLLNGFWGALITLILIITASVFFKGTKLLSRPIFTPFSKKPFEFIIMFRKTLFLLIILYLITGISIYVSNPNLSVFVLVFSCLISLQGYSEIENEYILWNYNIGAKNFLSHKIKRGIFQLSQLTFPIIIPVSLCFPEKSLLLFIIWLISCLLIVLIVLLKYSVYPRSMNFIDSFIITLFSIIPLFILILYYFYYKKAINNLKRYGI